VTTLIDHTYVPLKVVPPSAGASALVIRDASDAKDVLGIKEDGYVENEGVNVARLSGGYLEIAKGKLTGHLSLAADGAYDLGGPSLRCRDVYLAKASGSILFSDGSKIAEDNANLFWDNVNKRLGIGTTTPGAKLEVNGNIYLSAAMALIKATTAASALTIDGGPSSYIILQADDVTCATIGAGEGSSVAAYNPPGITYLYRGYSTADATTPVFEVGTDGRGYFAGNVGVGTTTPGAKLDVNGDVRVAGGLVVGALPDWTGAV
jgi:hypothetical protein